MRSRVLTAALALAAICVLCVPVSAQYQLNERSRLGIAMTFVRPSDGALTDIQSVFVGPVLSLHATFDKFDRPTTTLSVGWFGAESGPSKSNFIPVKATYIKRFGDNPKGGLYVGGSVGIYFADFSGYGYDPFTRNYVFSDENGQLLSGGVTAGVEFGGAWFAEASYDAIQKLDLTGDRQVDFSGLSLSVGSRLTF